MTKTCLLMLIIGLSSMCHAKNYYVDITGSDTNAGTLASPYKTIQHAAKVAIAGDTIFIRKGIYRETIIPAHSGTAGKPIVFINYKDEVVTISAAEQLTGWVLEKTHSSGKVWKTKMNSTLNTKPEDAGMDQFFVDGEMQTEARWPNISSNPAIMNRSNYAIVEGAKLLGTGIDNQKVNANYTDNEISSFPSNFLSGAYINFLNGKFWWPLTGKVTSNMGSNLNYIYEFEPGDAYAPRAGDIYFLWGKYEFLDAPGEWFRKNDDTVFIYTPNGDSPNNHLVEVKKRQDIFSLEDRAYITICNIKTIGGGIKTNVGTTYLTIDNVDIQYTSHYSIVGGWWYEKQLGIVLKGANSVISNSHIAYAVENGIKITGNNSKAINNVIHDVGYMGMSGLLLACTGNNMELKNNTVWGSGGPNALDFRESSKSKIWYNDASECGKGTFDGGVMMATRNFEAQNTEVAYNYVHDGKGLSDGKKGFFGTSGIYFESNANNYLLHHNLIWNIDGPGICIPTEAGKANKNFKIYNNTLHGSPIVISNRDNISGSEIKNNIFTKFEWNVAGVTIPIENNITTQENYGTRISLSNKYATDPKYIDKANKNFMPAAGSPAIDAGLVLAPYTNNYIGAAPDIGAFETGKPAFIAGALVRPKDISNIVVTYDNASFPDKKFTVSGLPPGRKVPLNTQLKIGTAPSGGTMGFAYVSSSTTFTNVPKENLTGVQDIFLDLGTDGIYKTKSTIDLGGVSTYTVSFTVKDANGAPLAGASVVFNAQNATTTASGVVTFTKVAVGSTLDYTVKKTGYNDASGTVSVATDVSQNVVLSAVGTPTYSVTFSVKDAGSAPLADASVSFNGQTVITTTNGEAVFNNVVAGVALPYSVSKTGFEPAVDALSVASTDLAKTVVLTPSMSTEPNSEPELVAQLIARNIFSPNGDGINEVWEVEGIEQEPELRVIIFNVYGQQVYQAQPYTNSWNGGNLPDGVYYYQMLDQKGKTLLKGAITLVR